MIELPHNPKGVHAVVQSYPVLDFITKALVGETQMYNLESGLVDAVTFGAPQKRKRYIIIGVQNNAEHQIVPQLPAPSFENECHFRTVHDAIYDLASYEPSTNVSDNPVQLLPVELAPDSLLAALRNSELLFNHVITSTTDVACSVTVYLAYCPTEAGTLLY